MHFYQSEFTFKLIVLLQEQVQVHLQVKVLLQAKVHLQVRVEEQVKEVQVMVQEEEEGLVIHDYDDNQGEW